MGCQKSGCSSALRAPSTPWATPMLARRQSSSERGLRRSTVSRASDASQESVVALGAETCSTLESCSEINADTYWIFARFAGFAGFAGRAGQRDVLDDLTRNKGCEFVIEVQVFVAVSFDNLELGEDLVWNAVEKRVLCLQRRCGRLQLSRCYCA